MITKNFVQFINHASILVSNSNKSILTDPWYSGSVFIMDGIYYTKILKKNYRNFTKVGISGFHDI